MQLLRQVLLMGSTITLTIALSSCSSVSLAPSGDSSSEAISQSGTPTHRSSEDLALDPLVKTHPKHLPFDNPQYLARIGEVSKAALQLCHNPNYRSYFAKTPCLPAGMTTKFLQNNAYPNAQEIKVASLVFRELDQLNQQTRDIMIDSQIERHVRSAQHSEAHVMPRIHDLQNRFLKGKLTWGQYNRERLAIFNETANVSADL